MSFEKKPEKLTFLVPGIFLSKTLSLVESDMGPHSQRKNPNVKMHKFCEHIIIRWLRKTKGRQRQGKK